MDIKSLKDINKIKALGKGIFKDFLEELKKLKNVDNDTLTKSFNLYFVEYIKAQYYNFKGGISRRPFWLFFLFFTVIGWLVSLFPYLFFVYLLALAIPCCGLIWRRLYDAGLSGWWIFLLLIPFLGLLALMFLLALPSEKKQS